MKTAVLIASVAAVAANVDRFSAWSAKHSKVYSVEETKVRRAIFAANVGKVAQHNAEGHSWTMA